MYNVSSPFQTLKLSFYPSTHSREAEALIQVSLIAARLDSLLDCLRTAADHAAVRLLSFRPFLFFISRLYILI